MIWLLVSCLVILISVIWSLKPISIPSIPNATPALPILGNAIPYRNDPVGYLQSQRALHGDIFHVNLIVLRIVFFLGPQGTNAIFRGSERSGISLWAAAGDIFSETAKYRTLPLVHQ